jgi:hypothetical protein
MNRWTIFHHSLNKVTSKNFLQTSVSKWTIIKLASKNGSVHVSIVSYAWGEAAGVDFFGTAQSVTPPNTKKTCMRNKQRKKKQLFTSLSSMPPSVVVVLALTPINVMCLSEPDIWMNTPTLLYSRSRACSRKDGDNLLLTLKKKNFRGTISKKWAFKNCLSPYFHFFFPHPLPLPPPPKKKKNPFFRHIFWIYRK